MVTRHHFSLCSLVLVVGSWNYASGQGILQFHGSGSIVPSNCFWHLLETMRSQTKIPAWMTYRAISSGPGQDDLMGNITHPFSDFASSDYPLSSEQYNALKNASQEVVHLPVFMGATGVFHSLPLRTEDGSSTRTIHLNLTSCLVARIYKGEIEDWTHPDIVELNPNMNLPVLLDLYGNSKDDQSYPIKVAHRTAGSSTTLIFTSYLHKACPEHWDAKLVGTDIVWPMTGSDRLFSAESTPGLIALILNETGTIGYSDSGPAVDEELQEVALKMQQTTMKEPFFLTSENALSKDGVAAALKGIEWPSSGTDDWSGVDTVNQVEGYVYAWPMVMVTYVLVRKDLTTSIPDPRSQTFLVEFLRSLYNPIYNERCEKQFLLLPVRGAVRDLALQSIDTLVVSPDAPVWTLETDVLPVTGQGDFVISSFRQESFLIQQDLIAERMHVAEITLKDIVTNLTRITKTTGGMQKDIDNVVWAQANSDDAFLAEKDKRIDASFAMAIAALVLWLITLVAFCFLHAKLRELEARPRIIQPEPQPKKKRVHEENV